MHPRAFLVTFFAIVLSSTLARSEAQTPPLAVAAVPSQASSLSPPSIQHRPKTSPAMQPAAAAQPLAEPAAPASRPGRLLTDVKLADLGFINGVRLSNLGGHRELFVPLPQDGDVAATDLVLAVDDISAFEARRNLEVQVNDRTVAAIALDGKSRDRTVRISLGRIRPKDGYLKISFLYSGAATLDRCIDLRFVGDTVTIKPETAVEVDVGPVSEIDVATITMLMPRDVAIVLPSRRVTESEIATSITIARSLISTGRRVSFHHGFEAAAELAKHDEAGRWMRGVVLVGPFAETANVIDPPLVRVAGASQPFGALAVVRVGGSPALLVSDSNVVSAGRLFGSPWRAATRGVRSASVGETSPIGLPTDRVTFEQLAVAPAQADVFGRADLVAVIDTRRLPPETRATRLLLDVMVAPDGGGEKAVVSVFVNELLLGSAVAAVGEATHLDLDLPDGLLGAVANVRAAVQRNSAQGNCRLEVQGYPAQILGSSALQLASADGAPHDFSDLRSHFGRGIKLLLPSIAADQPSLVLALLAQVVDQLSPDVAPLSVNFTAGNGQPAPDGPFIAFSDWPPAGANPRVRFDGGRVAVTDRAGRTLLDLGGFVGGAVAQVTSANDHPGLWIRPLAPDGAAPSPNDLHLDHGDVAFIDGNGVALAMSTERDTVVRIAYPDQVSWLTVAERFRPWIIGGLWLFATAALLFVLQRMFRRRAARTEE
jgi:cellulose synthase operon protein B